jgi:glycosyltransferase involved in cell wall biosynthesis
MQPIPQSTTKANPCFSAIPIRGREHGDWTGLGIEEATMRIIFHQRVLVGKKTGVGHYASGLLEAMRLLPEELEIDCFPSGWLWSACHAWAAVKPGQAAPNQPRSRLRAPIEWASNAVYSRLARCGRFILDRQFKSVFASGRHDLYHEPNFIPLQTDLPTVVTVHDLSVLHHPEWHPAGRVKQYERRFHAGLRQCERVITVSESVRQEMIRTLNFPPERVSRVYNGIHPHLGPLSAQYTEQMLRKLELKPGYLLYLGTIEPRKNILMLLRAYCALPQSLRERSPLLLVGSWGWKTEAVREFYESEARHKGVQCLGYLPDQYLPLLYNGARALVYPSFYEGFGLPCMEMLACGGAVLASTADVFRETLGKQAALIPAEDCDAWRAGMARVIEEEDWCLSLRNGATRAAQRFTWDNTAAETVDVYRQVCGAVSSSPLRRAG